LFVAQGTNSDLTPNKLKTMIKQKIDIADHLLEDIKVLNEFSFLTVPFKEAELILNAFLNTKKGEKSLIVKEKKNKKPQKERSGKKRKGAGKKNRKKKY
ncbi:MAG: DbpA RNA binding domain-containing protein, partial [Spirochaetes bacterium]|nr:DbpA RNA binding domain-containing protein [Spirochaetota bacterium]